MNQHRGQLGEGSEPSPMGRLEHRVGEYTLVIPLPYAPEPPPGHATGYERDGVAPPFINDNGDPVCLECGLPAPRDGQHWCSSCRSSADQGAA